MTAKKHVLIVDDFEGAAELLANILSLTFGDSITSAVALDGVQAVESAVGQPPDVILLDLNMPRMNGVEAAEILRKSFTGSQPVLIALTGNAALQENAATAKVFDHVLQKPADFEHLLSLVETAPIRGTD